MPAILPFLLAELLPALCRVLAVPSRDSAPRPLLSPVELRIVRGLAAGHSMRELAAELSYSYGYVRELAASAIERLGAQNTTQAVAIAVRRGLIR
jgi:DNA-binding CsgD family transcriptional regulator